MSAILALTTVIVLMIVGLIRRSRVHATNPPPVIVKRFIHPGHTWVRETEDGDVLVGIDDFAQSLIGNVEGLDLPRLLKSVEQGRVAWKVRHGSREIPMVCPVSGRVIEKNEMVAANPALVNTSPYGDGWLIRIRPRRLSSQLHNLMTGKSAQQWLDGARAQLARFFSGTPALMYQDGGVMLNNLADRCSDQEWGRLVSEFFLVDQTTPQH
ncbi:MAG TPA: glycine cleavage system protein H [Bacteroidota bacterium]|nr:glycine cleavage system protein H [Bacteroidota bacterium]